jgi:hypothetical protein
MNKPFKHEYTNIQWEYSNENFQAWATGRTGYPIVDAAMRCLVKTGYMYNFPSFASLPNSLPLITFPSPPISLNPVSTNTLQAQPPPHDNRLLLSKASPPRLAPR